MVSLVNSFTKTNKYFQTLIKSMIRSAKLNSHPKIDFILWTCHKSNINLFQTIIVMMATSQKFDFGSLSCHFLQPSPSLILHQLYISQQLFSFNSVVVVNSFVFFALLHWKTWRIPINLLTLNSVQPWVSQIIKQSIV